MILSPCSFAESWFVLVVLIVAGSFGLEGFTSFRYEYRKGRMLPPEIEGEKKLSKKEAKSLEEEYEEYKKQNLDDWDNIRGPRPWEDSKTIQDSQRQNLKKQ